MESSTTAFTSKLHISKYVRSLIAVFVTIPVHDITMGVLVTLRIYTCPLPLCSSMHYITFYIILQFLISIINIVIIIVITMIEFTIISVRIVFLIIIIIIIFIIFVNRNV